jgi:beta-galactosidase/beta-glucuronidase
MPCVDVWPNTPGQDHWWLTGIHRDVRVLSKPAELSIVDYSHSVDFKTASADSVGEAAVDLRVGLACGVDIADSLNYAVRVSLYGPRRVLPDAPAPDWGEPVWHDVKPVLTSVKSRRTPARLGSIQPAALRHGEASAVYSAAGDLLAGEFEVTFRAELVDPDPWTAETPELFMLTVELLHKLPHLRLEGADGTHSRDSTKPVSAALSGASLVDVEACWVGIRTVTIDSGLLSVNGTPLTIAGVNRHEHTAELGKAVSWESMVTDVTQMKRFNFNAVRTSHYPCCSAFYDLCDALGLWVVDEANIETHGYEFCEGDGIQVAGFEPVMRGLSLHATSVGAVMGG